MNSAHIASYSIFAFTLALKLNSGSHLSSKRHNSLCKLYNSVRLHNVYFPFNVNGMASLSSAATSRANKHLGEDRPSSQEKYTFQGKRLNS